MCAFSGIQTPILHHPRHSPKLFGAKNMKKLAQSLSNPKTWFVWLVALLLLRAAPGWAAIVTVTSAADSGPGSLRTAIAGANPGDYIDFAVALAGQTIHLTSGELSIGKNLTIDASGFGEPLVINAGGTSRRCARTIRRRVTSS